MLFRFLRRLAFVLGGVLLLSVAALGLGAIPFPASGWGLPDAARTERIYVLSNGFHSDIALSKAAAELGLPINPEHFPVNEADIEWYAVGWGSRTAFLSLRAVSDLTPSIVARALALDETVIHVTPLGPLEARDGVFAIDLTPTEMQMLLADIARSFRSGEPIDGITQGFGDRFYQSYGRFSPINTCNSWTGRRLRNIGRPVGLWTPIAWSLEWGLQRVAVNPSVPSP